ncbi:MAG: GNAT family N-acetyltransferase [Defluviitaleaceae bacterium]|nr:GNAT family N-acetyltransferase [Defluviitaleaceae bacterium]MCL2273810.1 GNAT family N-acetyltransferase [Defluviitaleaceae bacterium]
MSGYTIRNMRSDEINTIAAMIADGYKNDIFFHWVVDNPADHQQVVCDYYKVYLNAAGCVAHVAEAPDGTRMGATVWLPDDVDPSIYDEIDRVTGKYAPQFRAVADASHESEPDERPFYQLVGFVVDPALRGKGIGAALLKHQLDILDKKGVPTYLEASTPFHGGGVYGKFGYERVGELLTFSDTAVLWPLWRGVKK